MNVEMAGCNAAYKPSSCCTLQEPVPEVLSKRITRYALLATAIVSALVDAGVCSLFEVCVFSSAGLRVSVMGL